MVVATMEEAQSIPNETYPASEEPEAGRATLKAGIAKKIVHKKRTQTRKKPRDHPRRPLNAYNFFFSEQRELIVQERDRQAPEDKISGVEFFSQMGKLISQRWKKLTIEGRKKYQEQAEKDKVRYSREMDSYNRRVYARLSRASGNDDDGNAPSASSTTNHASGTIASGATTTTSSSPPFAARAHGTSTGSDRLASHRQSVPTTLSAMTLSGAAVADPNSYVLQSVGLGGMPAFAGGEGSDGALSQHTTQQIGIHAGLMPAGVRQPVGEFTSFLSAAAPAPQFSNTMYAQLGGGQSFQENQLSVLGYTPSSSYDPSLALQFQLHQQQQQMLHLGSSGLPLPSSNLSSQLQQYQLYSGLGPSSSSADPSLSLRQVRALLQQQQQQQQQHNQFFQGLGSASLTPTASQLDQALQQQGSQMTESQAIMSELLLRNQQGGGAHFGGRQHYNPN